MLGISDSDLLCFDDFLCHVQQYLDVLNLSWKKKSSLKQSYDLIHTDGKMHISKAIVAKILLSDKSYTLLIQWT